MSRSWGAAVALFDFVKLKASIGDISGQLREANAKIESLRQERDDLRAAPVSKEDFLLAAEGFIDRKAAAYPDALMERITTLGMVEHGQCSRLVDESNRMDKTLGLTGAMCHTTVTPTWKRIENSLYFILNSEMKSALRRAVDQMAWPDNAVSIRDKEKRIAEIDRELSKLEKQQAELAGAVQELRGSL